jgi:uncharacterized protein (TIGR02680 family)
MSSELFAGTSLNGASRQSLPRPKRERWQPLRSGLLNIFKYDEEEFLFEDGRLLLRGNNGAGKSRVLALQLPFLLDGAMDPHRVEPDADPAKRMEWNLLMNRHENRLGYTWIEFGRRDPSGLEHYLTLGCGIHARKGTGIPQNARWFFVTAQRMGETLRLLSENRVPLNRERLEAAIGQSAVYRTAGEYRAAVDKALFGLGVRYDSLIELLLQLRKPQIMRDFRADDLSRLLSEALPPLSPRLIENVSVSFRSLESDRQQVSELTEARNSVETFLRTYRHYVRTAVRRRAAEVRSTHSRFETAQREIKRLAEQHEQITIALAAAAKEERRVEEDLAAVREAERTLLASPEMKSAEDLRHAVETRDERTKRANESEETWLKNRAARDQRSEERKEAEALVHGEIGAVSERQEGLAATCQEAMLPVAVLPSPEDAGPNARKILEHSIAERVRAITLLRQRNSELAKCIDRRKEEQTRYEQRRDDVMRCEETEAVLRAARARALEETTARIYEWESSLQLLSIVRGEDWRVLLENWLELADTPSPLAERTESAYQSAAARLFEERSRSERILAERYEARNEVTDELDGLREGRQPEPPAPYTRASDARINRSGGPLWKLCGFRDEVVAEHRAGIEAALESAGLLDAWVTPEGALIDAATHDTLFVGLESLRDAGLNSLMRAEGDFADAVERILGCIGIIEGEGETWVSSDGRWRHGILRGAWQKPAAEYIGHASREEARGRRIAELSAAFLAIDAAIAGLEQERSAIETRAEKLAEERNSIPNLGPLQRAAHVVETAQAASAGARARLEEIDQLLSKARDAEHAARETRDRDAADLGLAEWRESGALERLESLLAEVRVKAAALWPAWAALLRARVALEKAASLENEAQSSLDEAAARLEEVRQLAAAANAHYLTLRASVGATADQVLKRLEEVRTETALLVEEEKKTRKLGSDLRVQEAVITKEQENAEAFRVTNEVDREGAIHRLELFAKKRLLEEAGEDLQPERPELTPNRAVELARRIDQALESVAADEEAWKRVCSGIQQQFSELIDQLGVGGYHPQAEIVDEGVFAVTCAFHGQTRTMCALHQSLSDEMQSRMQMLNAREREVIENHLIGEVATELQGLIRAGEDWVRVVNEELDQRPASSGIKLRFTWEVDPEATDGIELARRQLLKMTAAWSPAERDSIGRFLQSRINAERAADETAPWHEHLRRALDYRGWHRFGILRFQDGQWKKLTKKTYGTGSGGEKAVTLTLPQFAAAAAHYRSAAPHAPRLILLDEVFIGIDKQTRSRLMGLLANFDLDFVMTSELEWGCYATLPTLSICQLASRAESPAVLVTRWVWNGRHLLRREDESGA